jgi:hypothetical protein
MVLMHHNLGAFLALVQKRRGCNSSDEPNAEGEMLKQSIRGVNRSFNGSEFETSLKDKDKELTIIHIATNDWTLSQTYEA